MVETLLDLKVIYGDIPEFNGVSNLENMGSMIRREAIDELPNDLRDMTICLPVVITERLYLPRGIGLFVDYLA